MKHVISYSGGLGSFATAYHVVDNYSDVELIFTDTKTEDEDLYRFIDETVKVLGCKYTVLADGRDIWQVMEDVRFQANSRVDPCSRVLKRELFRKHIESNYDTKDTIIYFGIDKKESHRMDAIRRNWEPWKTDAPLIQLGWDREYILDILDTFKINPPRLYEMGFPHNNCGGFCVKTGQKQMKLLLDKMPERYAWHEARQEALFEKLGKRHGFIRKTVNGEMKYLGLKEFREMLERGESAEMWSEQGCGCFV
jgi:3'-phosphoadenosine 5'-phosphosulfate sulfotransferase (PAPS reductase)/FAD synthetase